VGEIVEDTAQFAPAFERCVASGKPAVIEVRIDPQAITPSTTLDKLRAAGKAKAADMKKSEPAAPTRKSQIDAVLLKLPNVKGKKLNGLDAYFVNDRMFACISGDGVGLRLPVATATELQFSRENVVPFQPGGMASSREWIQINRADAAEYEKDLELFQASLEFVAGGRTR
jgi:hypothetical protein